MRTENGFVARRLGVFAPVTSRFRGGAAREIISASLDRSILDHDRFGRLRGSSLRSELRRKGCRWPPRRGGLLRLGGRFCRSQAQTPGRTCLRAGGSEDGAGQSDREIARNEEIENLGHDRTPLLTNARMLHRVRFRAVVVRREYGFRSALGFGIPEVGQGTCTFLAANFDRASRDSLRSHAGGQSLTKSWSQRQGC